MNDVTVILLRSVFLYFSLLLLFRLIGKREIGELSILDLVGIIMIGDIAVLVIENPGKPLMHSLLPILAIALIQIMLALLSLRSQKFREVIEGKPTIIINKGKIDEKMMRKQRYNFDDLLIQLRQNNIIHIEEVEYAILEPSGQLSIIEKKDVQNQEDNLPFPLVVDGVAQEDSLSQMGKNHLWLRQQLKERGYQDIKSISICTYDDGVFYIDEK
ncbi:DUF421 domain-containing protein [Peribacillus cavernae]|uniref:DUF421 domain-containing protein n=1 Tax=Peribacillus cavernae TaxID=1674310 RepID=A0A433HHX3_9BACI|nr:DUF421 domain-containing protein [Peribacillus cavernae]MDQ0219338.1 uncharacterized membrane protein YcaP (DUF421 family) [Peribacillus cavernae]RUQ27783.1 DUF421 domain-containing protein [Peribacillus cavernae]